MLRRVPFEKIENFRDLGGYASNYGETQFGVIYRSGSLSDATPSDIEKMASLGIKSILDLRGIKDATDFVLDKIATDPRFQYYRLPVNGAGRVPTSRADMVNSYIEMLDDPFSARTIFLKLAHAPKPLVIHCSAGKDRTGCFCAILLLANGVPFHDVNADYMLSFPYLTRLARVTKKEYPDFPQAVLMPSTLFLKKVMEKFNKKWGGIENYFEWIGLKEDDIKLLENLLGKQEKSCGAVVFHDNQILVEHMKMGHYSLPKGHVEAIDHNDDIATVKRELKEETNLDVEVISSSSNSIDYSPFPGVNKRVVFYLAKAMSTETKPQPEEVQDIYWLDPNDAVRTLSHESDKKIAVWAYETKAKENL